MYQGCSWTTPLKNCSLHAGSGTRAHPEKRQSRKAAMKRSSRKAAKPQSRKAAMERASRKAAKLPWNAQSRKATKPQSRKAAKPQGRRAASSATHAPPPAFIAAALPPPWIAEAAKPQSRKAAHGTRKPQSRKAAKPQSRKAAEPQALRLMRRLLRSSPLRCHRHGSLKPQSRKAAKPQALRRRRRLLCSSPLCCQSIKKRQRAANRQGVEAPRSVKVAKLQEAPKRQEASLQSFKKRHSAEASKSRQRKAGCA